ncbi:MAG: transcriptional repressor LexA [Neisseriaceae bacterium]|jgi:repressor LexA|nr:MAG: transcriptional repressor LexA [Neisseriaceae bacterium]
MLTARQTVVLDFIKQFAAENGTPPTFAEIAEGLGFKSVNAAVEHVKALAKKGVLELQSNVARGIRLKQEELAPGVPLVGRVAAGSPILATEHVESRFMLDPALLGGDADYLLRVRGNSMINAGILDGDLIAVRQTHQVKEGQLVVARLGEDVTVKRWHREGKQVQLIAENPDYPPINVDLERDSLEIEGVCIGVIRSLGIH